MSRRSTRELRLARMPLGAARACEFPLHHQSRCHQSALPPSPAQPDPRALKNWLEDAKRAVRVRAHPGTEEFEAPAQAQCRGG
mgnify:CR=1 FL=1